MTESTRKRTKWWWVFVALGLVLVAPRAVIAVHDADWWGVGLCLCFLAIVVTSRRDISVMRLEPTFPSNREWLSNVVRGAGLGLLGCLITVLRWATTDHPMWPTPLILWLVLFVMPALFVPRAVREFRRDPDASYFREVRERRTTAGKG